MSIVKGLLVAGGSGTRLSPFTNYTHKTLLPLYDRPVIDFAMKTMRQAGITEITIIANSHIGQIAKHLGSGEEGEKIHYVMEDKPEGVANALMLARPYIEGSRMMLYFSDNITSWNFKDDVASFMESEDEPGAVFLAREVDNPRSFGVCELDERGEIVDIVEKPENPKSNLAIGGIYLFDSRFWKYLDSETKSSDGDFSISKITRLYVRQGNAVIRNIGKGTWVDCGTPETLISAGIMAMEGDITASLD